MKYKFNELSIGETFTFNEEDKDRIYSASSHAGRRHGKKFVVNRKNLTVRRVK